MEGTCRISGRMKQNADFTNFENKCGETRGMEAMGVCMWSAQSVAVWATLAVKEAEWSAMPDPNEWTAAYGYYKGTYTNYCAGTSDTV